MNNDFNNKLVSGVKNFGTTLKNMRKAQGLTLQELAEKVGCSYQLIWSYEHNGVGNVPLSQIEKVAQALGTTALTMLGLGDHRVFEDADKVKTAYIEAPENIQRAVRAMLGIE